MDGSALFEVWDLAPQPPLTVPEGLSFWDLEMRERHLAIRRGCANPLRAEAALAFDGRFLAGADGEQPMVLVWDSHQRLTVEEPPIEAARELDWDISPFEGTKLDTAFPARCLAFAPARSLLGVGGAGLLLYDPFTENSKRLVRSGPVLTALAFGPDGRTLLAGTEGGTAELWDARAGARVREFGWDCGPISAAAVAPDGNTCAVGTETGQIVVWDLDGD
jgi:WD40 repeat protein